MIFLTFITLIPLLSSCISTNKNFAVAAYPIDASDGISALISISKDKLPFSSSYSYYDENADKEVSVVFEGVTYIGTYHKTYISYLDNQWVDVYRSNKLSFSIIRDTKEIREFGGGMLYESEPEIKDLNFSEKQCIEIANSYANQYINVSEYEINTNCDSVTGTYLVTYKKPYNNIDTSELLMIETSYVTGKIMGVYKRSIGQFDNDEIAKNKSSIDLLLKYSKAVADKKAKNICEEICDKKGYELKSITEEEEKRILYRYENGDFALITKYNVELDGQSETLTIVTTVEDSSPDEKIPAE